MPLFKHVETGNFSIKTNATSAALGIIDPADCRVDPDVECPRRIAADHDAWRDCPVPSRERGQPIIWPMPTYDSQPVDHSRGLSKVSEHRCDRPISDYSIGWDKRILTDHFVAVEEGIGTLGIPQEISRLLGGISGFQSGLGEILGSDNQAFSNSDLTLLSLPREGCGNDKPDTENQPTGSGKKFTPMVVQSRKAT
jgi:hypothetical protein